MQDKYLLLFMYQFLKKWIVFLAFSKVTNDFILK